MTNDEWPSRKSPRRAAQHVEINAHGDVDAADTFAARTNWGFLDGHAQTLRFGAVYRDLRRNRFDPQVAK